MKDVNLKNYEDRQYFYGTKDWKITRKMVLDNEPLCRQCRKEGKLTPATEVDHIVSLEICGPKGATDPANLCPLCKPCHSTKTAKEMGWGPKEEPKIINRKWNLKI